MNEGEASALDPRASRGSVLAILLAGFLVWTTRMVLPGDLRYGGIDRSWSTGLGYAAAREWQAGVDYVFTYGPLGAFSTAAFVPELFWTKLLAWEVGFQLLVAVAITLAGARIAGRLERWLYFLLILAQPLQPNTHAFLSLIAVVAWVAGRRARSSVLVGAAILAATSLVKFTFLIAAVPCALAAAAILWRSVSAKAAALFLLLTAAGVAGVWKLCGQSFANFPAYIEGSRQIASGYSEGMSTPAPPGTMPLALLLIGLVVLLSVVHALERPRSVARIAAALAHVVMIWVVFKAGFVRAYTHTPTFFAYAAVAPLLIATASTASRRTRRAATAARLACAAASILGLWCAYRLDGSVFPALVRDAGRRVAAHSRALLQPARLRAECEAQVRHTDAAAHLPRTRRLVGRSTVDMISSRQFLVFANELEWRPRPIFQGCLAFTPELMERNAQLLAGDRAPEFILFLPNALDSRFPTMEDATALQVVARKYAPALLERGYILLRRDARVSIAEPGIAEPADVRLEKDIGFGETVELGDLGGRCHLLRLDVGYSIPGRILKVLHRAPPLWAEIELDTGEVMRSQIVPCMARAAMIVDPVLRTEADWRSWYVGRSLPRPVALRVLPSEAPWMYRDRIGVQVIRADEIVPPSRPGLQALLRASIFPTPPVEIASSGTVRRTLVRETEALVVPAPAEMRFDVGPGQARLSGRVGLLPSADGAGARMRAVLRQAGKAEIVLLERDLPRDGAGRELEPFEVRFQVDEPASLWLLVEPHSPRGDSPCETCWASISIE